MKRSLEKARALKPKKIGPAKPEKVHDAIASDPTAIDMGNSYDTPPSEWRTCVRVCDSCRKDFIITAGEQQFWYETLKIPFYVRITDCLDCRSRHRAQRRIAHRLGELMPLVDDSNVDEQVLRQIVLIIGEGTVRRTRVSFGNDRWVLSGAAILLKGCEIINRLRRAKRPHHDLLPLLRHFHQRLENVQRAERIVTEIASMIHDRPALDKAIRAIEDCLKTPGKRQWERVIEQPRL